MHHPLLQNPHLTTKGRKDGIQLQTTTIIFTKIRYKLFNYHCSSYKNEKNKTYAAHTHIYKNYKHHLNNIFMTNSKRRQYRSIVQHFVTFTNCVRFFTRKKYFLFITYCVCSNFQKCNRRGDCFGIFSISFD